MLDVATAEFRTVEAKCFATDERHGFRFDLADMHSGPFAIHQLFGGGMPENDVGYFVEGGFMREGGEGAYGDFACSRKALNVAIYLVKWRARDIQRAERRVDVKAGSWRKVSIFPLGLCQHKPIRPKSEGVVCLWFGCLVLNAVGLPGSLERHGHAEGDSFFPLADLPFPFEPPAIGIEWSGLQVASDALFEREQCVPDAECELPDYVNWRKKTKVPCILLRSRVNIVRAISRTLAICEVNPGLVEA